MHCFEPPVGRQRRTSTTTARMARLLALSMGVVLAGCEGDPVRPLPMKAPGEPAPNASVTMTWPQVSVGAYHSCALMANGSVTCWGGNEYGQATAPPGAFSQLGTGYVHTCAIRTDGTIACWGFNNRGQATPPAGAFTQVSGGGSHSCALAANGDVTCWGDNFTGQVGGPPTTTLPFTATVTHPGPFTSVSAGSYDSCALRADGSVSCWGRAGVVGPPPDTEKFIHLDNDVYLTCAVRVDGTLVCWGSLVNAERVPEGTFTQVSTGFSHACAVRTDGDVVCWGFDGWGQVSGDPPEDYFFVISTHDGPFTQVSAGGMHTCAARGDGSLACWGAGTTNTGIAPHWGQSAPPMLQASQSISFTSAPPSPAILGGGYTVSATGGSSGNPVLFSSLTPTVCTTGGSSSNASAVAFIAVGTCTVAANQYGDASHLPAPQVLQTFAVIYQFGGTTGGGFASPVSNTAFNAVRAGQAVPIKFDLGGDQGPDVLASGYPRSVVIACPTSGDPVNAVPETTITAGASNLTFDAATGLYTYVWKTDKAWAGTCRRFTIRLDDATEHSATFQFAR